MKQLSKADFLFCYDVLLHRKLKDENIPYITSAISNHDQRFWLYQRTDKVNSIVKQHSGIN